jgi:hypothetical protein
MTYREEVEQFISQFDITHSVTVDIDFRYSFYRTEKYQDLFKQDLKIFVHQLNRRFYGRMTSKSDYDGKLPIVIPCVENLNNKYEPIHFHISLGNLRKDELTKSEIEEKIKKSWYSTKFHEKNKNKSIVVKEIFSKVGWSNYITKEMTYKNKSCVLFDLIQTSK